MTNEEYLGQVCDEQTVLNALIKQRLADAVLDVLDNLVWLAKHAKGHEAKVSACRTILRLAMDTGTIEAGPVQGWMNDLSRRIDEEKQD
jgi:hypothetical protein